MNIRVAKCIVPPTEANSRLDYWISQRFTYHSRHHWQRLIAKGNVLLNDQNVKSSTRIKSGDLVEYLLPNLAEPVVSNKVEIIYEDDFVLVVNKPGNLPCHPGGKFFKNTLWNFLHSRGQKFWIINRLDRETSGLVLVAKTLESARFLYKSFTKQKITKGYLVLVEGCFPCFKKVDGYIRLCKASAVRKKRMISPHGDRKKEFVLSYFRKIEVRNGMSFLAALPKTGRTHQIRASLKSIGFPVIGDKIYGSDEHCYLRFIDNRVNEEDHIKLKMDRQGLHAFSLGFQHPGTMEFCSFTAKLPKDIQNFLLAEGFKKYPTEELTNFFDLTLSLCNDSHP